MEDLRRLGKIRQDALKHERNHSRLEQWWEEQTEWLKVAWSKTAGPDEYTRFLWIQGNEVQDDDGKYVDTSEDFV
ncbi:MAG: hypothetical protein Q9218_005224 [Villophora microphyllina]